MPPRRVPARPRAARCVVKALGLPFASPVPAPHHEAEACDAQKKGSDARTAAAASLRSLGNRARGLFLLALLSNAALQGFACLVLARLADFGALRGGRLALAGVFGLGAHLAAHAIAPFVALLAFAGLFRLLAGGLGLGEALLAVFGIFRLRAVETAFCLRLGGIRRRLGESRGAERQEGGWDQDPEHGMSFRSVGASGRASPYNAQPGAALTAVREMSCFSPPASALWRRRRPRICRGPRRSAASRRRCPPASRSGSCACPYRAR